MKTRSRRQFISSTIRGAAAAQLMLQSGVTRAQTTAAKSLRVAGVAPLATQPHQKDDAVVFYDDFAAAPEVPAHYLEYNDEKGAFVWVPNEGMSGGAMRCQFEKGQVSAGWLHLLFGKNPLGHGVRPDQSYREIFWRIYVKHEVGWEGNPAKLARATCMAGRDYSQGFIAHVWGGKGDTLCIDPATGIVESQKVSTRYNDFAHLKWLGLRNGTTPIFSPAESGRWVCVESHIKLNTPGQRDGVFELWVDGRLEASRTDLDWHGNWGDYAINAVFLENYWNQGSLKRQARWFDSFVVSTRPIGPIVSAATPVLSRTRPGENIGWEAEVATDTEGADIVWRSKPADARETSLLVDAAHGAFTGGRAGQSSLASGVVHWVRVRPVGGADWSPWHASFKCG